MPEGENRPLRFTEVARINGRTYTVSPIVALAEGIEYLGNVDYFDLLPDDASPGDCYTVRYKGESTDEGTEPDGGVYVFTEVDGDPQWILFETDVTYKANKVDGEVAGHIPSLTAEGDLADSGVGAEEVSELLTDAARKDGTYPELTAGTANQIGSSVDISNDNPYSFRSTAGGMDVMDSVAHVSSIRGQTIRWRQMLRNDTTTQLSTANTTMSLTNGVFRVTSKTDNTAGKYARLKLERSHTYAVSALIAIDGNANTTAMCSIFKSNNASVGPSYPAIGLTTSWKLSQRYITTLSDEDCFFAMRLGNATPKDCWAEFKNVMLFDVTEMYGAGNEPTEEQFWSTFPGGYYEYAASPILLHTNVTGIKAVGFNAFNPETRKARVLGGKEYEVLGTYSTLSFEWRDANGGGLGIFPIELVNGKYTPPHEGYLSVSNPGNDFCIHLVWGGTRDGETEAYWSSEMAIPIDEYFEGGMAGIRIGDTEVCDELTSEKAILRTRKRTLDGTESWELIEAGTGGAKYFRHMIANNTTLSHQLILSDRFPTKAVTSTDTNIGIRAYVSNAKSYISVRPDNFEDLADAEAFKTWLAENPINVVYARRASDQYVETDVALDLSVRVSDFGTEEALPINTGSVPATTELHAVTLYKRNLREKLERLPEAPDEAGEYVVTCDGTNLKYTAAGKVLVAIEDMSSAYSEEQTYETGSYCIRDGDLYMAVTDISVPEEWNGNHWLRCTVGERMESLQQAVDLIAQLEKNRGLTPEGLQAVAASGHADEFFEVGDVVYIPWTDNAPSTPVAYQYPFVVADFRDAYDENNVLHKNAVVLQALYATPSSIVFDAPEIVSAPAGGTFEQNVHYFTKSGNDYNEATVTVGATIPDSPAYYKHRFAAGRIIRHGYNRYSQSAIRQWLNSDAQKGTSWWTAQHDFDVAPEGYNTIPGFLDGFTSEWKSVFKPVRVQTLANTVTDDGITDITYDRFFLASIAEMYGSQTNASVEGAPWQYWIDATGFASGKNGSDSDTSNARKIPVIPAPGSTPGAGVNCRLRSASLATAYNAYRVHASGYIYADTASGTVRALPACFIY